MIMRQACAVGQADPVGEVAVAGHLGQAARQPGGRADLGAGPEPVRHHVGQGPGAFVIAHGDLDVFPGHLGHRVDHVLAATPADMHPAVAHLAVPLRAGPRDQGQEVGRVGQLHDVQATGGDGPAHRTQVGHQVVQGHQVAGRVQHGDGQADRGREREVPHVGPQHLQLEPVPGGLLAGVGAHGRAEVERRGLHIAPGELQRVLGGPGGQLQHRAGPGRIRVLAVPAVQRVDLAADVTVGTGKLVQLGRLIDSAHPDIVPEAHD